MPFTRGKRFILPFLVLALASLCAQGQNAGAIHGTVTDPSGAVIPGATVRISNSGSGLARTATSALKVVKWSAFSATLNEWSKRSGA